MTKAPAARRKMPEWSLEEDAVLQRHYPTTSAPELAALLGREAEDIYLRARRLKLHKKGYEDRLPAVRSRPESGAVDRRGNPVRRRCHDCGRPTSDYRCPKCRQKWKVLHGLCHKPRSGQTEPEEEGEE